MAGTTLPVLAQQPQPVPEPGAPATPPATAPATPPEQTGIEPAVEPSPVPPAGAENEPSPEPATEPVSAAPAEEKPKASVSADEKGFALKAAGDPSPFVLKVRLVAQLDARKYMDELHVNDTMAPRRLRPYLDGTVLGLVDYRLLVDFAGGTAVVYDAYVDVHPKPWLRFRFGKFKTPIGLERLQSDPDLPFAERAMTSALTPDRDVGLQLWGDVLGGVISYAVGIFNGAPDGGMLAGDTDTVGGDKDFAGRLLIQPFKLGKNLEKLGHLGAAIAGTYGERNGTASATGTSLAAVRTVGRLPMFAYQTNTMDATMNVFAEGPHTRINPELFYYVGGLGVLAEAVWSTQEVHAGDDDTELTHFAWHATASYVLGGKNGLDGATPDKSLGSGGLGALEIGVRYHEIDYDDDSFPTYATATSVDGAKGFGISLNWAWSRMFRLMADFESTQFDGGAADGEDRDDENLIIGRAQVVF
jgi:phosphate-selective porin OprO and OprP